MTAASEVVVLDDRGVTIDDVIAVARDGARVEFTERSLAGMAVTRARIDELAREDVDRGTVRCTVVKRDSYDVLARYIAR